MEVFKSLTGTFITHVPYRGAGPAAADVVGGQVDIAFDGMTSLAPFVRDGRLIPIVLAAPQRVKELPNVPTFKEVGVAPLARMPFNGIVGPKGMAPEMVDRLNAAIKRALEEPAVRKRIEDTGTVIVASTPDEFAIEMKLVYEQCKKVVAERKLTLD
jgi:tripartite-type tricarboxylate transporter receptor subunit TctC